MTGTRAILGLVVACLISGCGLLGSDDDALSSDDVLFTTKPEMRAGETVVLQLSNVSRTTIYFNLCAAALERSSPQGWSDIAAPKAGDPTCTEELRELLPGWSISYDWGRLREDLSPGTYRFRDEVEHDPGSARLSIVSNAFTTFR